MNTDTSPKRWQTLRDVARQLEESGGEGAAKEALSDLQPDLDLLLEEGALVENEGRVRFFHDTLGDYVLARTFAEHRESLLTAALKEPQDLARRPLVRRMLTFLRSENRAEYSKVVKELLSSPDLRFHLKDVVYSVLRQDEDPTDADYAAIEHMVVDGSHRDHPAAWSVATQPAWFRLLDRRGEVIRWMASEEATSRDRATNLLFVAQRTDPDRVATLLQPFLGMNDDWDRRIATLVGFGSAEKSAGYCELLTDAIETGLFDDGENFTSDRLWMAAHDLPKAQPDWALDLLDAYLERGLTLGAPDSNPFRDGPFVERDYWPSDFVSALAESRPREFADATLPFFLTVLDGTATETTDGTLTGDPWSFRHTTDREGFQWALLRALDTALQAVARSKPRSLRVVASDLAVYRKYESARYLLYRAWTANPAQFADIAITYLTEGDPAFRCGYMDSHYWVTRQLIEAVQKHASGEGLSKLEAEIREYVPSWEKTAHGRRARGLTELTLLRGFDRGRLSSTGRKRLAELERKFPSPDQEPTGVRGGIVPSPIPDDRAAKMSDDEWLSALETHSEDEARDLMDGGAMQLSRVLEQQVQNEPHRFAQLALRLPFDTNPTYVSAVLLGLGDSTEEVDPGSIFEVLRRFSEFPGRPGGRWISKLISRVADGDVPTDIIDLVSWFATEDPDPSPGWEPNEETGELPFGGDLFSAGINSVRGSAAEAVSHLIWPSEQRMRELEGTLRKLAVDPSPPVRACAVTPVYAAGKYDESLAVELFLTLIGDNEAIAATPPAERFLQTLASRHLTELGPVLRQMLQSASDEVQQTGARQVALAFLNTQEASDLLEDVLAGGPPRRLGFAEVASYNVTHPEVGQQCRAWLETLLNDPDDSVRSEAASWVFRLDPGSTEGYLELLEHHISSAAYADDEGPVLRALDEATGPVSEIALRAVLSFVKRRGSEAGDLSSSAALDAGTASKLAIRAYTSADSDAMRTAALDAIDALLAARVSDLSDLITQYD